MRKAATSLTNRKLRRPAKAKVKKYVPPSTRLRRYSGIETRWNSTAAAM
jgi:hypothetical protein